MAVHDSVPFDQALFPCGPVSASVTLETDQPCCDIDAVLSLLTPDGKAWTLTQGHARIDAFHDPVGVPMWAVCVTIPSGHAPRLSVAAAASPSYAVNPWSGALAADFTAADERVITITIPHGASCAVLPAVT